MNAYKIFSKFYDQYIEATAPMLHQRYYDFVLKIINKFQLSTASILDVTCGTGTLAKIFLDNNFNIEGADISEEMLNFAKIKGIKTYKRDLCKLDLGKKYDIILCFDSFGHVLGIDNMQQVLISISNCLKDNGVLICDGGTKRKAQSMIGQTYNYDSENYRFIWTNAKNDDYVLVHFNIDEKSSGNRYEESFFIEGHDIEDMFIAANSTELKIIYATLEPIVKLNGSFLMCLKKEVEINKTQQGHSL